jgi:hypothetical protein
MLSSYRADVDSAPAIFFDPGELPASLHAWYVHLAAPTRPSLCCSATPSVALAAPWSHVVALCYKSGRNVGSEQLVQLCLLLLVSPCTASLLLLCRATIVGYCVVHPWCLAPRPLQPMRVSRPPTMA